MHNVAEAKTAKLRLRRLKVQNLRGFTNATLRFDSPVLFLVGPNNAGKTSILRLMDVLFNWDLDREFSSVSDRLLGELLPARETRNSARRLTLEVGVQDGRRYNSLKCENGVATLRLSLTLSDRRLRLNLGKPRRGETREDEKARQFLNEIRESISFVYIPASRSADSGSFKESLNQAVTQSLASAFNKPGKGATVQEKAALDAVGSLESLAIPAQDFWRELLKRLPAGWVRHNSALPEANREALARFIAEHISLSVTTGDHDASGVPPVDVGSGLQSLINLELSRFTANAEGRFLVQAIEEPEVFLHPSAQRRLGREISRGLGDMTLASTHSPLIVEEASFAQVTIVRDHSIIQPRPQMDGSRRRAINTALMQGRGAEVLFARSVLLVEGPGDREYWEALRRRLAHYDPSGAVDQCYVVDLVANSRCAPWLQLFQSYPGTLFRWIVLLDADSATQLREAAKQSDARLSKRQQSVLDSLQNARKMETFGTSRSKRTASRFWKTRSTNCSWLREIWSRLCALDSQTRPALRSVRRSTSSRCRPPVFQKSSGQSTAPVESRSIVARRARG